MRSQDKLHPHLFLLLREAAGPAPPSGGRTENTPKGEKQARGALSGWHCQPEPNPDTRGALSALQGTPPGYRVSRGTGPRPVAPPAQLQGHFWIKALLRTFPLNGELARLTGPALGQDGLAMILSCYYCYELAAT